MLPTRKVRLEVEQMANLHFGQKAGGPRKAKRLHFGCWNMRTLVESEGTIATAAARKGDRGVVVDRKASFMVQECSEHLASRC